MPIPLPPLSLYVHIPWCLKKCPYCDFNSHAFTGELPEAAYIDALLDDLARDSAHAQGRELVSIFMGGGTPSLFSSAGMARLLDGIQAQLPFAPDIEITLEANPGTFETQKFRDFRQAGCNRLSLGIQSFDRNFLTVLGRVHDDREALAAAGQARAAGFDNFNLDLMFGLPGQQGEQAMADLQTALEMAPAHLSWYQLTLEPNTVFYRRPPTLPDDDDMAAMQAEGIDLLAKHGLARYEISAYATANRQSRHNLNYWQFGDYLGIGAGAHGKITQATSGRIVRTRKRRQPNHYLAAAGNYLAETTAVSEAELPLEFFMNVLRLRDGVDTALYTARTGLSVEALAPVLSALHKQGLLRPDRLATTATGFDFLNDVLAAFLPNDDQPGQHTTDRIPVNSVN